jgi:hypothetical protein
MKVRLTRKFAELINGVDLSKVRAGDTLDLSTRDAQILLAEGWAAPEREGGVPPRSEASDQPRRKRTPRKKH